MHLIQILLPLRDAKGRGFPEKLFDDVAHEMTERFGGVTAFTRMPAEGRWKPGADAAHEEDIIVIEVMVEDIDPTWWRSYRRGLEKTFKQKKIIVRAQPIALL